MKHSYRGMSGDDRKGVLVFAAGVLILASIIFAAVKSLSSPENDYDRTTLCNENTPRHAHHLFIIDVSDSLSVYQERFLRSRISDLLGVSQVNDRFSIFILDEKYSGLSDPVVDLCKPKSAGDVDVLTSNRVFIETLYRSRFEAPLEKAIASVVSADDQKISPIYEALSDIAALSKIDPRAEEVNLTIVSDMIQNSEAGSVFSSGSRAIDQLPAVDLRRVRTRVFWLDREKYRKYQTDELESSWKDYLAGVSRFDQIEKIRN